MPAKTLTAMRRSGLERAKQPRGAVLYARVSSKDQEKEGFSIPAQRRLLGEYATGRGLTVLREFVDVETAKASGRLQFTEMLRYLKKHQGVCQTILVEKTDRLYRNFKDWTALDDLGPTIHFVKEGRTIGPDSASSDQFVHGINVLMARNYILNLGEETSKGMLEKARSGIYPSYAPVGYRNTEGPNGKRIIVPDPQTAPIVKELFTRFAAGSCSLSSLVAEIRQEGAVFHDRKLHKSTAHQILRKRLYMGEFDWDGTTYQGTHEPLVTRECWEHIQKLLDARNENKTRKVKHDFAFSGLVHCGHCRCHMVGEIKKRQYVYYHCTGNRGKCPEPYTRQEVLTAEFAKILGTLAIPRPILEWLEHSLVESDRTEQAARAQTVTKLQTRSDQIKSRVQAMYLDKLDGRIEQDFFDKQAAVWRGEQETLQVKIRKAQTSAPAPIGDTVGLLAVTSKACELFLQQPAAEQRRLLQVVVESAAWQDGALRTILFEPFETLRHSNRESHRKENDKLGSGRDLRVWLLR